MKLTERYVAALETGDYKGLADLFDESGSLTDFCPKDSPYRAYGREAIEMLYRNRFYFGNFKFLEQVELTENHATFIAAYNGYRCMVRAMLMKTENGEKIRRVVARPA